MSQNKLISIIVRTRNEERWITQTLDGVFGQDFKDFEVILVDNESSDMTIEKAGKFNIKKVLLCRDYIPGKALNMGIREASGNFIVCLSGHCIPVNSKWLGNLHKNFSSTDIAGVYGRQEPMAFTSDADKRDLGLVFGLDKKIQAKDSFFHNANSMIRKDVWVAIPFDETATNIEDRIWAKEVIEKGYKIIYEPEASVYHYHGIHQNGDVKRCANVVRIMDSLKDGAGYRAIDMNKLNVVAIIPVRGKARLLKGKPLLAYTLERAVKSKYIKRVIVSTDNEDTASIARKLGAEVPFIRDSSLSEEDVDLARVLAYSLERIEAQKIFPDLIVSLEITFPFRTAELLDDMVMQIATSGYDSVIAARKENRSIWKEREGEIVQLDDDMTPRKFKEPSYIGLKGVGCVTHPEFLRRGSLLGKKIGIYEVNNPYSHLEVRSDEDFRLAEVLAEGWFK